MGGGGGGYGGDSEGCGTNIPIFRLPRLDSLLLCFFRYENN